MKGDHFYTHFHGQWYGPAEPKYFVLGTGPLVEYMIADICQEIARRNIPKPPLKTKLMGTAS